MTAIVFDLDGTLVESAPGIQKVANRLMDEIGLAPLDLAEVHKFVGAGTPVFLQRAFESREFLCSKQEFSRHLDRMSRLYEEAPGADSPPMPGADAVLRALHKKGCELALCTNKWEAPTRVILSAHDWSGLFEAVIAGDTLAERKPDPAPLIAAAEHLRKRPVFYVGDSDIDAETAEAAGIPFLIFTEGYRRKELSELTHAATFSDFTELPTLIGQMAGWVQGEQ
ncbi:MAG: phosphoglycolate phosphatase [Hyphomicrobiaceae bacterium]